MGTGRKAVIFTVKHTIDDEKTPGYLPGVENVLAELRAQGWLTGAIHQAPGTPDDVLSYIAKMLRRQLTIDYVATCGHARNVNCLCGKPRPYLVNKVMAFLKVEPEDCVFVGASYEDVSMGRAAGVRRVYFVIPDTSGFSDVLRKELLACII